MNERLRKTGATLSATIALGGLGVGATKLAEGQPAMAAEQQVAHANAHEQGELGKNYKWDPLIKRNVYIGQPELANSYPEALAEDYYSVDYKYIWDGLVLIHNPKKNIPFSISLMPSPSSYYESVDLGGNDGKGLFFNPANPHFKKWQWHGLGEKKTVVCPEPMIGWGKHNKVPYLAVTYLKYNSSTGQYNDSLAFIDLDLAMKAGAVEFFAGNATYGSSKIFHTKRHVSGNLKKISGQPGNCLLPDNMKSTDSVSKIRKYMHWFTGLEPVNPPHISR